MSETGQVLMAALACVKALGIAYIAYLMATVNRKATEAAVDRVEIAKVIEQKLDTATGQQLELCAALVKSEPNAPAGVVADKLIAENQQRLSSPPPKA